jgi:hypothetical protein
MGRVYAGVLGTLAMAVVLSRGAMDSGGVEGTLTMAMVWMVVFAIVGSVLGQIAQATVDESVRFKIERELAMQTAARHEEPKTTV